MQNQQTNKPKKLPLSYANFNACGIFNLAGRTQEEKLANFTKMFQINAKSSNDKFYSQMTISLNCGKDRLSFAQLKGYADQGKEKGFYVHNKNNFADAWWIDYQDRAFEPALEDVSPRDYILVGLERATNAEGHTYTIYKRFLSAYDAVNYIYEHIKDKMELKISGDITYTVGKNGEIYENKSIKKIILAYNNENEGQKEHYCTFSERVFCTAQTFSQAEKGGYYELPVYSNVNVRNAQTNTYETVSIPHKLYVSLIELPKWEQIKKIFFNITSPTQVWTIDVNGHYSYSVETEEVNIEEYLDAEKYPQWAQLIQGYQVGIIPRSDLERAVSSNKAVELKLFSQVRLIKNPQGEGEVMAIEKDKLTVGDLNIVDTTPKTPTKQIVNEEVANTFKKASPFASIGKAKSTPMSVDESVPTHLVTPSVTSVHPTVPNVVTTIPSNTNNLGENVVDEEDYQAFLEMMNGK